MHVLYIHQYFATLDSGTGTRSYEFARRLVAKGHVVTVLTGPTHLTAFVPNDAGWVYRFQHEGIAVVVANVSYHQSMSYFRRVASFGLFALLSAWLALRVPRPNVTYASSTPLTVALPALVAKWFRWVPYVFEVRDIWPAVPVGIGVLRNRVVIWCLRRLERRAYLGARHVVALSPGMADEVHRSIGSRRPCSVITNCADTRFFESADREAIRHRHGWENACVLLHAGAMGKVNGLDAVLRAADALRDEPSARFALVGEGRERARLEADARSRGLSNVVFMDSQPKRDMPGLFAAADICLMVVAPHPVLEHNSANKFFDALAAGKPVVLNYGGWQREVLEATGAGVGSAMGDDAAFTAQLRSLIRDAARREAMGGHARRLARERFDRDRAADDLERILRDASR